MRRTIFFTLLFFLISPAHAHWRSQPTGASSMLRAVSGGNTQLFIVGDHGTILGSKDGVDWHIQSSNTSNDLNAVFAIDSKRAIAIGDFGAILTTNDAGVSWATQPNNLYQNLNAIWGSKDSLFIAGNDGLLLRSTDAGASWTTLKTNTTASLFALWGSSLDNIYAVGKATVLHSKDGGTSWTKVNVGAYDTFTSIWGASANELYITERDGRIYSTQNAGKTWTRIATDQEELFALIGGSSNEPLALCPEGLLRSTDKGKTWSLFKKSKALHGALRRSDGALFFVGEGEILTYASSTTEWSQTESGAAGSLRAIWGSAASGVFISSYIGDLFHAKDGETWSKITNKNTPNISSLWGSVEGELFALATNGTLHLSTNKGQTWSQQDLPVQSATLRHIWGIGDNLFIVGSTILASNDRGRSWSEQKFPAKDLGEYSIPTAPPILSSIWGGSANDVYLVGESGTIFHTTNGGTTWKQAKTKTSANLHSVWGSSKDNVYAVGDNGTILHSDNQGNSWRTLTGLSPWLRASNDKEDLHSIWGSSPDNIYIAGVSDSRGLILHSSDQGKTWSHERSPAAVMSIWGLSDRNVYALALDGTILQTKKGMLWQTRDYPKEIHINAAWKSPNGTVYAVGAHGEIQSTKDAGKTWKRQASGVKVPLYDVWGASDDEIFVSGANGLLLATKNGGALWEARTSGTAESLFALWGDTSGIYVVGGNGTILRSKDKGKTWSKQPINNTETLYCIWGSGATLYVAGASGVLWKTTNGGTTWSKQKSGVKKSITGIWGGSKDNVYLVGDGFLSQTKDGGKTWSNSPAPRKGLRDIWGASTEQIYIVGAPGLILQTKDGGKTWIEQSTGTNDVLSDILGLSDGSILLAGDSLYIQDSDKTWTVEATSKSALNDVWSDGKTLYAAGSNGAIWSRPSSKSEANIIPAQAGIQKELALSTLPSENAQLQTIFGANGELYTAGYKLVPEKKNLSKPKSVFLSMKDNSWKAQPEIDWMISDIWVSEAGSIFAVGETFIAPMPATRDEPIKTDDKSERKGALLTSTDGGKNWRVRELEFIPLGVWGDEKSVYLVGEKGSIWYSKNLGNLWEKQQSNVSTTLTAAWGRGSVFMAVGTDGVILRTEDAGKTWKRQRSNTNSALTSIRGDGDNIYITGEATLQSKDKGQSWEVQPGLSSYVGTGLWAGNGEVFLTGNNNTREGAVMRLR